MNFSKNYCTLIDSVSHYDLILGRDFCSAVGIDVLHSTQEVVWQHTDGTVINTIPFCSPNFISNPFDLNVACFDALAGNDDMEINNIFDPLQDFKKNDVEQIVHNNYIYQKSNAMSLFLFLKNFLTSSVVIWVFIPIEKFTLSWNPMHILSIDVLMLYHNPACNNSKKL